MTEILKALRVSLALVSVGILIGIGMNTVDMLWPKQRTTIEVSCEETTEDIFLPKSKTLDM